MPLGAYGSAIDGLKGSTAVPGSPPQYPVHLRAQLVKQAFEHNVVALRHADAHAWAMLAFSTVATFVLVGASVADRSRRNRAPAGESDSTVPGSLVQFLCAAVAVYVAVGALILGHSLRSSRKSAVFRADACVAAQLKLAGIQPKAEGDVHSPASEEQSSSTGSRWHVAVVVPVTDRAAADSRGELPGLHEGLDLVASSDAGVRAHGTADAHACGMHDLHASHNSHAGRAHGTAEAHACGMHDSHASHNSDGVRAHGTAEAPPAAAREEDLIWNEFSQAWTQSAGGAQAFSQQFHAVLCTTAVMISAAGAYAALELIPETRQLANYLLMVFGPGLFMSALFSLCQ